jgi:hypothetical protein
VDTGICDESWLKSELVQKDAAPVILFVCKNKSTITDFIMWADVEFAMQLEILEMKKFQTQEVTITDLSELKQLATIATGETLYILCHGSPGSNATSLQNERYSWAVVGEAVGTYLGIGCTKIVLFACYAAVGVINQRPMDHFTTGLSKKRQGVTVVAYQGATVTNTYNTLAARDKGANSLDAVLTLDDQTNWMAEQGNLISQFTPQLQFNSYLQSNPNATPRAKAINAAERTRDFCMAYGTQMQENSRYYAVGVNQGAAVTCLS